MRWMLASLVLLATLLGLCLYLASGAQESSDVAIAEPASNFSAAELERQTTTHVRREGESAASAASTGPPDAEPSSPASPDVAAQARPAALRGRFVDVQGQPLAG